MSGRRTWLPRYSALCGLLVILDFISKFIAERSLFLHSSIDLLPFLQLVLVYNRGAAFGFLGEASGWQLPLFLIVGGIVCALIVVRVVRGAGTEKWFETALVLILAGAIGNLLDRIRFGYVIDFISIYWGNWQFPAFNIADATIFLGALMLIFELFGILPRQKTRH